MDLRVGDKLAVVTGGSRNVGRAAVEQLAREGCRVVLVSRGPSDAQDVVDTMAAEGHTIHALQGDVSRSDELGDMFATIRSDYGDPDILVYSNGGPPDSLVGAASTEDYLTGYQTGVVNFLTCVDQVVGQMKEKRWGRIITLGSMCAKYPHREVPMIVHNIVRPAALGASRTLANELGKFGITVNTIGTGRIDSGEGGSFRRTYRAVAAERGVDAEELMASLLSTIAVGRAGRPEELGALCAFLCSDLAGFITGQLIICDGGQHNVLF